MFSTPTIQQCFSGLIGFRPHHRKDYPALDNVLTSSLSGIYVDHSAHPLLTIENIAAIAENFDESEITDWVNSTNYIKNDLAVKNNKLFIALQDHTNKDPESEAAYWRETNLLSQYLYTITNNAASNLFSEIVAQKKLWQNAKTLLTDTALYDGVGNLSRPVTKNSRFVGFALKPSQKDTTIKISHIGLQLFQANGATNIYIYHSSQVDPLYVVELNHNKERGFQWEQVDEVIRLFNQSNSYANNGTFYVGYYEDDLLVGNNAVWKEVSLDGKGCSSCNSVDSYLRSSWSKYLIVSAIYVDNAFLDPDKKLFDVERLIEVSNQNWGMNLKLQVECDITDLVCRNKTTFAQALQKWVVRDLLREMAYSSRNNQLKEAVSQKAMYALQGTKDDQYRGYEDELIKAVKAIGFDLSGLSDVCLPCEESTTGSIHISTVF